MQLIVIDLVISVIILVFLLYFINTKDVRPTCNCIYFPLFQVYRNDVILMIVDCSQSPIFP